MKNKKNEGSNLYKTIMNITLTKIKAKLKSRCQTTIFGISINLDWKNRRKKVTL